MKGKDHYDTLGLTKSASQDEIKAAFRKLSMQTHPDTSKDGQGSVERFKLVSEAHSILSIPAQRSKYDRQLRDEAMWRGNPNSRSGDGGFHRPFDGRVRRPARAGFHSAMETMFHPKYIILGVAGFGTLAVIGSYLGIGNDSTSEHKRNQFHGGSAAMVEAWKNPSTGRWEQPAPWDPTYQRLRPTLTLIPRDQVTKRNLRSSPKQIEAYQYCK